MIRILRASGYRSMPWKNGGGVTTEIAIYPRDAGLDAFHWRVSMASVSSDGPFSTFTGTDRTLAVLEGEGIRLAIDGRDPVLLTGASEPLSFPADVPTEGTLKHGPILDLNVMVSRDKAHARVERHVGPCALDLAPKRGWTLLLVNRGRVSLHLQQGEEELSARDCLLVEGDDSPVSFDATTGSEFYVVRIAPNL